MLQTERENLAGMAAAQVVGETGMEAAGFYGENVKQKFIFLLQAVDRLMASAQAPLLFSDILPGFDLVVMKPVGGQPQEVREFDSAMLSSLDDRVLDLLANSLEGMSSEEAGAHYYEAQDGLVYFVFRSANREQTLLEMGIDPAVLATADLAVGGTVQ